jgi:hypothetical protein
MDITAATPAQLVAELVARPAGEFVGAVVSLTVPIVATERWKELTLSASASLDKRQLADVFERAKVQSEKP